MTVHSPLTWTCFDIEIADHVAHIRLKRPEALNAMNRAFWNELPAIVGDIDDNARARCIVISSTGKHFSAGMDLSVFGQAESVNDPVSSGAADRQNAGESFRRHVHHLQDTFSCLDQARMPVLVAIQGGCIGGAIDMTSACDIRYATRDAFFVLQEINIGMTADVGAFPRLCKLIPEGWVRELAYTGRRLSAEQAEKIGLVNALFDTHEQLVEHTLATAREIASKGAAGGGRLQAHDKLCPRPHHRGRARLHRRLERRHVLAPAHAGGLQGQGGKARTRLPGFAAAQEADVASA